MPYIRRMEMITYYKINGQFCFSDREDLPYEKIEEPEESHMAL